MKATFWGTRGSLAAPGAETVRYGGNTSCVSIRDDEGTILVLDAGTGIQHLGASLPVGLKRIHILLTHLHMDHIQGLPFFAPLHWPGVETHIWGPAGLTQSLSVRLQKYLSPPLFPVNVRELETDLYFHELSKGVIELGEFLIKTELIIHPNPTIGFRIQNNDKTIVYLPDHEPAMSGHAFPHDKEWISGYRLAEGADLLIHDTQYSDEEYRTRIGFGHSSFTHAFQFAQLTDVKHFAPFHHDPSHSDAQLDQMFEDTLAKTNPKYRVTPSCEGLTLEVEK